MGGTVAMYVGGSFPPNLARFFGGLAQVVEDEFELEVVGRNCETKDIPDRFRYVNVDHPDSTRGVDELYFAYRDVSSYLKRRSTPPDAIWQVTSPHFHALPTILAGRRFGVPVATRIPGQKFGEFRAESGALTKLKTYLLNNVHLRTTRFSSFVVTLSENNRKNLVKNGIPSGRVVVLQPLLDTETFSAPTQSEKVELRSGLGIDIDSTVILYVGRLSRLKGMDTLLDVVASRPEQDDVEFHLVGTGSYESEFESYDNVVLHGYVSPGEVHRYYGAADLLVHPSYTEEEGISWTMLEAAATGLPVVARDIENASDIASFVFGDTDELEAYLAHPERWKSATYPTAWSIGVLAPKYNDFLHQLVEVG